MWCRRRARTSAPCVPARKDSATRAQHSTVSSRTSCAKEVISPTTTARAANPYTETSSPTRTSPWSTPDPVSCLWRTPDPTLTVPNSSSPPLKLPGWITGTWCSAVWSKVWKSSRISNLWVHSLVRPIKRSSSQIADNSKPIKSCIQEDNFFKESNF